MIATFPKFTKLDLDHQEVVNEFFMRFPPYSEFGFTNMFVWSTTKPVMLSLLNDNLVIKFENFQTKKYYVTLIGDNLIDESLSKLLQYSMDNKLQAILDIVPEHVAKNIKDAAKFEIVEDVNNHDYIVSIPYLKDFLGGDLHSKRRMLNHFNNEHREDARFELLDLNDPKIVNDIRKVLETWKPPKTRDPINLLVEFTAIEKTLMHHKNLKIECFGVYIGDKLEAFSMVERVHDKTVIGHFQKGNKNHVGIYEYMANGLFKFYDEHGYEYMNLCQDLGIEGLRNSKLSLRPVRFHKKYSIKHAGELMEKPYMPHTSTTQPRVLARA